MPDTCIMHSTTEREEAGMERNEGTTVLYRVPDTSAMRACVAEALAELRREALAERERWARYGELLGATR